MKKFLIIFSSLLILTGCSDNGIVNRIIDSAKEKATSFIEKKVNSLKEKRANKKASNTKLGSTIEAYINDDTHVCDSTLTSTVENHDSIIANEYIPGIEADSLQTYYAIDSITATNDYDSTTTDYSEHTAADDSYNDRITDSLLLRIKELEDGLAAADAIIAEKEAAEKALTNKINNSRAEEKRDNYEDENIHDVVEILPEFPGGSQAMNNWLARNIRYPEISKNNGSQGTAVVRFIVNRNGSIQDIRITRSSGDRYLDNEATRLISSMPQWTPGRKGGKNVRTWFTIPVRFRLQ